jgi:hypothetical protein
MFCSSAQFPCSNHAVVFYGRTDRQRLEQGRAGALLHQRQARLGMACFRNIVDNMLPDMICLACNQLINFLLSDGAKKWFDVSAGVNGYVKSGIALRDWP